MPAPGCARAVLARGLLAGPLGAAALWLLASGGVLQVPAAPRSLELAFFMLLAAPVAEELAFRGAVQDLCRVGLARLGWRDAGILTGANLFTSLLFAACHLPYHPAPLACAVVLPSLVLGHVREATGSVLPCILLHAWFNACYLLLFTR